MNIPKKLLLPQLEITKIAEKLDTNVTCINIPTSSFSYYLKNEAQFNNKFNLFPIILDINGKPWAEAILYILYRLQDSTSFNMATYSSIAEDLAVYKRFLDEEKLDWTIFPSQKLMRPTYRFNGHLKLLTSSGDMALSTAKRTMGTIISFYRWIQEEKLLNIENIPWKETDRYIEMKNSQGFSGFKKINSTDLSILTNIQKDPYDKTIEDGGKLKPLTLKEQQWLLDALNSLGNTEMKLIHLFSLLTGARIQTVLTLKVKHFIDNLDNNNSNEVRLIVGPGTNIDTKYNKKMVLHIPKWFYIQIQTYIHSDRSKKRRLKAEGGDTENQYLFLTVRSIPFYQDKSSKQNYDPNNILRHHKIGQGVRQFITEKIIPYIQQKYDNPNFHYRFHDLRATAGMNWTDYGLSLVEQKKLKLQEVREFVKTRMGHESMAVTDRYLQYRNNQKITQEITMGYEDWIKKLSTRKVEDINE